MFDNFLDGFADFPTVSLSMYDQVSSFTQASGILVTKYEYSEAITAHGFQKSAVQSYLRDKIFDTVDMVFIMDSLLEKDDLILYDSIWYTIDYPDNVGFASSVYVIGATRTERPDLAYYVVGQGGFIIGDSTGVVGWKTNGF